MKLVQVFQRIIKTESKGLKKKKKREEEEEEGPRGVQDGRV